MIKFVRAFIILVLVWISLVGLHLQELIIGIIFSLGIAYIFAGRIFTEQAFDSLGFARLLYFCTYIPKFVFLEVVAHLRLVKIIYFGGLKPDIVRVPLVAKNETSIAMTANSVTITPGTLTLTAGEKELYIHTIDSGQDTVGPVKAFERKVEGVFR